MTIHSLDTARAKKLDDEHYRAQIEIAYRVSLVLNKLVKRLIKIAGGMKK